MVRLQRWIGSRCQLPRRPGFFRHQLGRRRRRTYLVAHRLVLLSPLVCCLPLLRLHHRFDRVSSCESLPVSDTKADFTSTVSLLLLDTSDLPLPSPSVSSLSSLPIVSRNRLLWLWESWSEDWYRCGVPPRPLPSQTYQSQITPNEARY